MAASLSGMDTPEGSEEALPPGRSGFGLGLIVGAVVGAAVALLLAPGPGRDTRRQLRQRLAAARERVGDGLEDLDDRVRHEIRRRRR